MAQTISVPAWIVDCAVVIAIGLFATFGLMSALRVLRLHDWSKRAFSLNGFYKVYSACAFALIFACTIAIWMTGPARALDELAIARLSLHGDPF